MALLCSRLLGRNIRSHLAVANRFYAKQECPDPMELATGLEKMELEQIQAGNVDPFRRNPVKRLAVSTKENPNLVESVYDCRMVGCLCEEDSCTFIWMWVFKGEPRRCMCGHWFKLVDYKS